MTYQAYLNMLTGNDSWNTPARIEFIQGLMEKLNLEGKKVIDLGCRFGLFSYLALEMGASYVVGVDIEESVIEEADRVFETLGIDEEKYCFTHNDVQWVDFKLYDVILGLGFFYNIMAQERILFKCRQVEAVVLAEFWLDNNCEDYPVLRWFDSTKVEEYGSQAQQTVHFRQYLPNLSYANKMFERCGFEVEQLNDHQPGHCNVFFLLKPTLTPTPVLHWWGFDNGRSDIYNM